MPVQAPTRPSPEDQLRLRLDAAERYMRGDINADEFERTEQRYMPDYLAIMRALVKQELVIATLVARFIDATSTALARMTRQYVSPKK